MAYEKLNLKNGDLVDEAVFKRIDNALYDLVGVNYQDSPNLWNIALTTSNMTGKYYVNGLPYESTQFDDQYPATDKIYLKDYAPADAELVIEMERNSTYHFCCIPSLPTGFTTPWGTTIGNTLFFYDESDNYLSNGFILNSKDTITVPSTATYFRFNIHTVPTSSTKNLEKVLSAINKRLMVVKGTEAPTEYFPYGYQIETVKGSVQKLINKFYQESPNLWNITLTTSHLTGKYYFQGLPYDTSTQFDNTYNATEKIYLKDYAPTDAELVIDIKPLQSYRFYAVPALSNGYTVPWSTKINNVIYFYDESDNVLGSGGVTTSTNLDTITVPDGTAYFRFNIYTNSAGSFVDVLASINTRLMVINTDFGTPTIYYPYGELIEKTTNANGLETRPIFYNIENEVVDIISHYNSEYDLRYNLLKKGPNSIFDYGGFYLVPVLSTGEVSSDISGTTTSWNWSGTDSHGPFVMQAVSNADGDNLNDDGTAYRQNFTGGNHGYDNSGSTTDNSATGRTANIKLYADGKEVASGSGYCNQVKIYWDNYVQAYNTTKSDGTGREVLREVHETVFDGYEWKEEIHLYPLEDIIVRTYYGIQCIGIHGFWTKGYYMGTKESEANKGLLDFTISAYGSNSNSITSTKFVAFNDSNSVELEIDGNYDLGSGYLSNSTYRGFVSTSGKFYFNIINGAKTLTANTNYGFKAFYRFKPVVS